MRILVVGPSDEDLFADNVAGTLEDMGHEILRSAEHQPRPLGGRLGTAVRVASTYASSLDTRRQRYLVKLARRFQPEVILSVDATLRPDTVGALRQQCPHVVLWFPDHVSNMGRHEMLVAGWEHIFLKNEQLVHQLRDIYGFPVSYLAEAANPRWHRPIGEYGSREVIVIAGNLHPSRAALLDRLLRDGLPLEIYGKALPPWLDFPRVRAAHTGRSVFREEKSAVFRTARAVINNLHPAEYAGSNCRLFESAAAGALTLTEARPGMADLFAVGREVLTFDSYDVLLRLCHAALASPDFGRAVADAGAARAARDHTYAQRLEVVLDRLGAGRPP